MAKYFSSDRAYELAQERAEEWTKEDLAEEFAEWVAECNLDDPEYLEGCDDATMWDLFTNSGVFESLVDDVAYQYMSGDF